VERSSRMRGKMKERDTTYFEPEEVERLRRAILSLGTSYPEFIHWAVMNAVDEVEGIGRLLDRCSGPSESQVTWYCGARIISR
jgi:hypothetical protein